MRVSRSMLISVVTMAFVGLAWPNYRVLSQERAIRQMASDLETWRDTAFRNMEALEKVVSTRPQVHSPVLMLEVTAYTPTVRECNEEPFVAASMRRVKAGTVAVSRDLFEQGWVFGRKVYIQGHGIFEINDLMNSRFSNCVDVFMWDSGKAREFGRQRLKVALLDI
jgi:3D (Asp-Asp-Asp) domain-containing protein